MSHKCNLQILAAFHTKPTGKKKLSDDLDNFYTDWIFDDMKTLLFVFVCVREEMILWVCSIGGMFGF